MLTEADIRMEIDEFLKNKNWVLTGKNKNVFAEKTFSNKRPDYILKSKDRKTPLIVIEAKRRGKDLNSALKQAQEYAKFLKAPIAYATDGSSIKTIHISSQKPLVLNGEEIDEFIDETLALQFLNTNEVYTVSKKVIQSRQELIQVFSSANKELRKEGLQAGIERFSEFCTILFLKLYSEQELIREKNNESLRIEKEYRWDYFKNKDGNDLLSYVNDTVITKHFQKIYGEDIFAALKIKNPKTLKKIIEKLDELSLTDINSDIKGDAFEYFLKAYLAKQHKDLGEYFTPRHIVKTLVKLVNPKFGETIYDPFCGTGGILIESFTHIYNKMPRNNESLQFLKTKTIYGREITNNAKITKMNMILTGDGHNNIKRMDSLANPIKDKYNIVITNMPFSLGNFDEYSDLYSLGSSNGNFLCIEHCFQSIKEGGRMAIIIPDGILFDKKYTRLRKYIYDNSYVENIISLPSGSFKPYTEVKTSILYLKKIKEKNINQEFVWHFTVNNDGYTLNTKREKMIGNNDLDIFLGFNNSENENNLLHLGFNKLNLETIKNNNFISIPNAYKIFNYNSNSKIIELGLYIEELRIKNKEKTADVWSVTNNKGFVKSSERFSERVSSHDISNYKIVPPKCFAYNPSRINVGSISINNTDKNLCVSPMYVVFKIKEQKLLLAKYLHWLLQSDRIKEQIKIFAFGTVRQTLNYQDFCKIKMPIISVDEQLKVVKKIENYYDIIQNAKNITASYKPELLIKSEWNIKNIGDLATTQYGYTASNYNNGAIRYIRTTDIKNSFELKENGKYINNNFDVKKYLLEANDILITRSGSVGNSFIFGSNEKEKAIFASYLVRLKFNSKLILPKYFIYFANTDYYWNQVNTLKDVLTQPNLNAEKMKEIKIPIPTLKEQEEIINKLNTERQYILNQNHILNIFANKIEELINFIWK